LPDPLTEYFKATNEHDVAAVIPCFAADAVVEDEGKKYRGSAAIQKWMEETIRKYDYTLEVTGTQGVDGKILVATRVTGPFPGSPVDIDYEFTLARQRIVHLVIR
jgi:ketosteroid isomerase-like protein